MRIRRLPALLMSLFAATLLLVWALSWHGAARGLGAKAPFDPLAAPLLPQAQPAGRAKLDRDLAVALAENPESGWIRVIIRLHGAVRPESQALSGSRVAQRAQLVAQLKESAAAGQEAVVHRLAAMQLNGTVERYRPFWIFNGIAATLAPDTLDTIASLPQVARISLDQSHRYFDPPADSINLEHLQTIAAAAAAHPSWGVHRIGAPLVWEGLGVRGEGVTVAIMDSGVDWRHPDLAPNYRGNLGGGIVQHRGNWYHAVVPTATEPVDLLGHGTHVAGTAVGQNGIGVAPGARWIAVAIADESGLIYDSDVHAGFQWLLAPEGDPSLAPDIINNSWGGSPYATEFLEDVEALHAAGIITLFAAGNDGPESASINSPASYTGTLAVGASDDVDGVAWFSSRGPSPLTAELKPWLVAPGTGILSALPGGAYGLGTGTSMATPHAAGAMALMLSADPSLSFVSVLQLLAETAAPVASHHPNHDSGWGRLDAYGAVSRLGAPGLLQGTVRSGSQVLAHTTVTVTTPSGMQLPFRTGADGRFAAALRPGLYAVASAPFGFEMAVKSGLAVTAGQVTTSDLDLARMAWGTVRGLVREAGTDLPLQATITVSGTPVVAASDALGRYAVDLPDGRYTLRFSAIGHRLEEVVLLVTAGGETRGDAHLAQAPSVLLVDSGQWYYNSYAGYYDEAIDEIGLAHDRWQIRDPFVDVPTAAELRPYDVVVWSAPQDSPGYLAANDVITGYLGSGGNLLISGQNVAALDGGAFFPQIWWYRDLEGEFTGKTAASQLFTGDTGAYFKGITLRLNGLDSAGNQMAIDQSRPSARSLTRPAFRDETGRPVALTAGDCDPFRIAYLGFGLEGVSGGAARASLLERAFDYFQSPRLESGVAWVSDPVDDFALPGKRITYTLTFRNLSERLTDTVHIDISNNLWPASLLTKTLTLGSCQSGQTILAIDVPAGLPDDVIHQMAVNVHSSINARASAHLQLRHKTPGQLLLVDDDRWYDREAVYRAALDQLGMPHDLWEIGWDENVRGTPPAELLNAYDFVIWYTGYDWFAPVTQRENEALAQYLAQGGRLFLSSQDFMYYHHDTPLARTYLGVLEHHESVTPTVLYGGDHPLLPTSLSGPLSLHYGEYQNFSDGLVVGPGSHPFIWHDKGLAAAVATAGSHWRAIFWSVPFEALPSAVQADGMGAILGWLGDLGESTFAVDKRSISAGETLRYTITVRNLPYAPENHVWLTNTLPSGLAILPASLSGGATLDAASGRLTWNGFIAPGDSHIVSYEATPAKGVKRGTNLQNRVTIAYERQGTAGDGVALERVVDAWVQTPDLSGSTLSASVSSPGPWQAVTYTLRLRNDGLAPARPASATLALPAELTPLTGTLRTSSGSEHLGEQRVSWQGTLPPGKEVIISIVMTREISLDPQWLPALALIDDGASRMLLRPVQPYLRPYQSYFPLLFKEGTP